MTKTKDNGQNRIWIELPMPTTDARAEELVAKANAMLKLLGVPGDQGGFGWDERKHCYILNEGNGSRYLADAGSWFNLDYLGLDAPIGDDGWKVKP
jgi:hypothetical protein